jgi:hypothetical protein
MSDKDRIRDMVMALSRGDHDEATTAASEVIAAKSARAVLGLEEGRRDVEYDYYEIHRSKHGDGFDVKGVKVGGYPESSVLAGQDMIQFLDSFDTPEEAKAEYPEAEMSGEFTGARNTFDHLPDPDGPDPFGDNWDAAHDDY